MLVFDELKQYMLFDADSVRRILEIKGCIEPHFTEIVAAFYVALEANPRTSAVFSGPDQVERLRGSLYVWLEDIFSGNYNDAYFKRHQRIGRRHVEVGLLPHYMFGAMNLIRTQIIRHVIAYPGIDDKAGHLQAVNQILDIELTIMLQSYWDNMMEMKLKIPAALASGLAHEIRNPLNALALNLTLLERKVRNLDNGAEPILNAMRSEVGRITTMTSEIIDFAKPVQVAQTWHSGRQLIESMRLNLGSTMDASGIAFEAEVLTEDDYVFCDLDRIKQATWNLLTNAIEAVEGNGGEIVFTLLNNDGGTEITVKDNGEGIPSSDQFKVFDLFYSNKTTGTGLGLPIVQKIVEAHDGAIRITSQSKKGTEFTICLPRPLTRI